MSTLITLPFSPLPLIVGDAQTKLSAADFSADVIADIESAIADRINTYRSSIGINPMYSNNSDFYRDDLVLHNQSLINQNLTATAGTLILNHDEFADRAEKYYINSEATTVTVSELVAATRNVAPDDIALTVVSAFQNSPDHDSILLSGYFDTYTVIALNYSEALDLTFITISVVSENFD